MDSKFQGNGQQKVQQLEIPVHGLDPVVEHQVDFTEAFHHLDRDGDGTIPVAQLSSALADLGFSASDIEEMIQVADSDGDGVVVLADFVSLNTSANEVLSMASKCSSTRVRARRNRVELRSVFEMFDRNGDGHISATELLAMLQSLGDQDIDINDCKKMIENVDTDHDGLVSFCDFEVMMLGDCFCAYSASSTPSPSPSPSLGGKGFPSFKD